MSSEETFVAPARAPVVDDTEEFLAEFRSTVSGKKEHPAAAPTTSAIDDDTEAFINDFRKIVGVKVDDEAHPVPAHGPVTKHDVVDDTEEFLKDFGRISGVKSLVTTTVVPTEASAKADAETEEWLKELRKSGINVGSGNHEAPKPKPAEPAKKSSGGILKALRIDHSGPVTAEELGLEAHTASVATDAGSTSAATTAAVAASKKQEHKEHKSVFSKIFKGSNGAVDHDDVEKLIAQARRSGA
jgi:hypothetical protein